MKLILGLYAFVLSVFVIFSYGFVDKNLILSSNWLYRMVHDPLQFFAYEKRGWAGLTYVIIIIGLFILYGFVLKKIRQKILSWSDIKKLIIITSIGTFLAFPAFSYDLFNYMTTARVTFLHKENPWVIKPIEIPNDPDLAYTRAANKVALYGPTWLSLTAIPHYLGLGNTWLTLYAFKGLVTVFYLLTIFALYKLTKNKEMVVFWGLNPLVQLEILTGGHNDIVMIFITLISLVVLSKPTIQNRVFSGLLFILSVFVKGATLILLPVYVLPGFFRKNIWLLTSVLLFAVFLVSPLREELYPWYAVWFLTFLPLVPGKKGKVLRELSIVLTFGLLLRYTPYIVTREYSGMNQIVRTALPILALIAYGMYQFFVRNQKKEIV
jgi:hypothetical protein